VAAPTPAVDVVCDDLAERCVLANLAHLDQARAAPADDLRLRSRILLRLGVPLALPARRRPRPGIFGARHSISCSGAAYGTFVAADIVWRSGCP
jgi:hypothetical protein